MTMARGVSKEDFDNVVRAVSDIMSEFCPGSGLRTVEQTYQVWKSSEPALICEIEIGRGTPAPYRGVALESVGWGEARRHALEDMFRRGGWPRAFSGEEMRLRLSLLSENDLRALSQRCAVFPCRGLV